MVDGLDGVVAAGGKGTGGEEVVEEAAAMELELG